jgi:cytoplasmic iron level regulating protein YaaA (DUF328/UPF0246 family)
MCIQPESTVSQSTRTISERHYAKQPRALQAKEIVTAMQKMDKGALKKLLDVSDKLAEQTYTWLSTHDEQSEKPCVVSFDGPAFRALDPASFSPEEQKSAQVSDIYNSSSTDMFYRTRWCPEHRLSKHPIC